MIRTPVKSSLLTSVGHDSNGLEVEFSSDKSVWRYREVSETEYDKMMTSEDGPGKYFMRNIRPNFEGVKQ